MSCARTKLFLAGAMVFLLLAITGCRKEDVVAPTFTGDSAVKGLKAGFVESDTLRPVNDDVWTRPISDDGDDLGDRESSGRPR